MQVFTPARPIRKVKSEYEQPSPEPVKPEPAVETSWKSFYRNPPTHIDVSTARPGSRTSFATEQKAEADHKDIQQLVTSRIKVLQFIHHLINDRKAAAEGQHSASRLSQDEEILMQWNTQPALASNESRDAMSFYLCALGMSHSADAWDWFRRMEEALMRARMSSLRHAEREEIYLKHGLFIDSLDPRKVLAKRDASPEDAELCRSLLMIENRFSSKPRGHSSTPQADGAPMATETYQIESTSASLWYRTRIGVALDAVRKRDVILRKGFAFVQVNHLLNACIGNFRKRLDALHGLASDQRVDLIQGTFNYAMRMIDTLCNVDEVPHEDTARDMSEILSVVKPQDVDYLSKHHFPPCMQQLNDQLNRDRHLKYHGRWQYGLFLKRIGLPMEGALDFFGGKESMGAEGFRRSRYGYSIRHYYGREGKNTGYSSMGCSTIIAGPPPTAASCHGCPFKHEETNALKQMVSAQCPSAAAEDIEEIVQAREGQHYSRACFSYFKLNRPGYAGENLFSSPYEFYAASTAAIKTEPERK